MVFLITLHTYCLLSAVILLCSGVVRSGCFHCFHQMVAREKDYLFSLVFVVEVFFFFNKINVSKNRNGPHTDSQFLFRPAVEAKVF